MLIRANLKINLIIFLTQEEDQNQHLKNIIPHLQTIREENFEICLNTTVKRTSARSADQETIGFGIVLSEAINNQKMILATFDDQIIHQVSLLDLRQLLWKNLIMTLQKKIISLIL